MADRLVVKSNGQVQQVGSQRDLYENPANAFVAGFVGRTNFLHGRVEAPGIFRSESGLRIRCHDVSAAHGRTLALRPERLSLASSPVAGADNCFPGTIEFVSYLGGILEYYVRLTPENRLMVQTPNKSADPAHAVGDPIHVYWPAQASLVLADDGGSTG
jgi:putative spermidine/putrescine transport system ATP-binding protein